MRRSIGDATQSAQQRRDSNRSEITSRDRKLLASLTPAERVVLGHLATGASNADIAAARGISLNTAKAQVAAITRKLGLDNRTQSALFALRHRIQPT